MSASRLHFPYSRVLLPRTKLAYVHLRNLLTDAKRDRSARVYGYVAVWLPEEMIVLYLQEGELVNATRDDGRHTAALPIGEAIERVPAEPEFGEICFHEAEDEQLACMYFTQLEPPLDWPPELDPLDASAIVPYLMATTFDGVVEVVADGRVNYLIVRDGDLERAYLASADARGAADPLRQLLSGETLAARPHVRRWPVPPPLPRQAPPLLIRAYREVAVSLVEQLVANGRDSAPAIAEHARQTLLPAHPALEHFSVRGRSAHDPVVEVEPLTAAVAAWVAEVLWAAVDHDAIAPERLLRDLTWERRHMFQSAGFFDRLPWSVGE